MKTIISLLAFTFTLLLSNAQELITGITYGMAVKEAKAIVQSNKAAYIFSIGTSEFLSPQFIDEYSVKIISFPEKTWTKPSGRDATEFKIAELKEYFMNKGYTLVSESLLFDAISSFGITKGNAFLMQKGEVYLSVTYSGSNTSSEHRTSMSYTLYVKITSVNLDEVTFKKYFYLVKPTTKSNADHIF